MNEIVSNKYQLMIQNGEFIDYHSKDEQGNDIVLKHNEIAKQLSFQEIIQNFELVLDYNESNNKNLNREYYKVKQAIELINKTLEAIKQGRFTDGFELSMKLHQHISWVGFDLLMGDGYLGFALRLISFKFSSTFFSTLELLENKYKEEISTASLKLLGNGKSTEEENQNEKTIPETNESKGISGIIQQSKE